MSDVLPDFNPNPERVSQLLDNLLISTRLVTAACISFTETVVTYEETPEPDWLTKVRAAVNSAQQPARDWINVTSPDFLASSTQPLIDYAEHFQTLADNFATDPEAASKRNADKLVGLAKEAQTAADTNHTALSSVLKTLNGETQGLSDAITAAAVDEGAEEAEVKTLDDKISDLLQKVSAAEEDIDSSYKGAAFSSISLQFTLLGFGYAVATAGLTPIPFMGVVAAVAGITVMSIVSGEKTKEIAEDLVQIGDLQRQLSAANQKIAGLKQLEHQLEDVKDAIANLQSGLSLKPLWEDVLKEAEDIQQLAGDASKRDAVAKALTSAAAEWTKITGMSESTQTASTTRSVEPIDLGSTLKA